jgi:hypothetical protein
LAAASASDQGAKNQQTFHQSSFFSMTAWFAVGFPAKLVSFRLVSREGETNLLKAFSEKLPPFHIVSLVESYSSRMTNFASYAKLFRWKP